MLWELLLLILSMELCFWGSASEDYTKNLNDDIFGSDRRKIDTRKRPVQNYKDTVVINSTIVILHVYALDEVTGTLITRGWFEATWYDSQLKWKPSKYNNITYIHAPVTYVWTPGVAVINSAKDEIAEFDAVHAMINSNGLVSWYPFFLSKTSCSIDHKYFPFDEHVCSIEIGSWSYGSNSILLQTSSNTDPEHEFKTELTVESPLWKVEESRITLEKVPFDCCPDAHYPFLRRTLRLRRTSPLYKFIFLMPSIMSIALTLAIFWLPQSSGEKITLGGIVVVIQLGLLLALGFTIPQGGKHVPHIVLLCGNSLVMTCLSLVISILVIRLSRGHSTTPVPSMLKQVLTGPFGLILLLGRTSNQSEMATLNDDTKSDIAEGSVHPKNDISTKTSAFQDWLMLATAIDHLGFLFYCISFGIIGISSFV